MNAVAPVSGKPLLTARALKKDLLLLSVCSYQSGWWNGPASQLEPGAELEEPDLRRNPARPDFRQTSCADLRHRNNRSAARSTEDQPAPKLLKKRETLSGGDMVPGWLPPALKLLGKPEGSTGHQPGRCRRNRKRGESSQN